MKNIITLTLCVTTGLFLASCGDKESTTSTDSPPAEMDSYPLNVCVVSGEELGSMGEPVTITHEGTEVRFCCDKCLPKFRENPDKYVAMVKAAELPDDHAGHDH